MKNMARLPLKVALRQWTRMVNRSELLENRRNETMHSFHKVFAFVFACLTFVSLAHAQDQAGTAPLSN